MMKTSSGEVCGKATGCAERVGWKEIYRALPWIPRTEADWSILSLTLAISLGEGGKRCALPPGIDTGVALRDNSEVDKLLLIHRRLAHSHECRQCAGTGERSRTAEARARGDVAVGEDLHPDWLPDRLRALLPEKLQSTAETGLEVIAPFVLGRVDFEVTVDGDLKFTGWELREDVGEPDGAVFGRETDGEEEVGVDGHGEDGEEHVVDVLRGTKSEINK